MKKISAALQAAYDKAGTSTCFLVKIVCKDGTVYGFSTLDRSIVFFDGIQNVTYDAFQEMRPQNLQQEANYDVDNTDLVGWLSAATEKLVLAGQLDFAELTIYRVSYLTLSAGAEVIAYGTVGNIDFSADSKGKRKVAFRSLTQQLKQTVNDVYSLTCRATFGDERCGMPLIWVNGTVAAVGINPNMQVLISGVAMPDKYFDFGVVEFLTGANAAKTIEVESWLAGGAVQFSFPTSYPSMVGDTLRIRRDCGKTFADCLAYDNVINMRAEHLTPVQDKAIMVPGAYITSVGSK